MECYKEKKSYFIFLVLLAVTFGLFADFWGIEIKAQDMIEEMNQYPGVTISPDRTAWTTDYLDKTDESLPEGYTVFTGRTADLRVLREGEHYYQIPAKGNIKISKWVVEWSPAQCVHSFAAQNFKGFQTKEGICESYYNNGWYAYCADCNEVVADLFFYAKESTIKDILSMPAQSCYLYICPHCEGLEQGVNYKHICKDISYNCYTVNYEKNVPEDTEVNGYMAITRHMYNNASIYEGKDVEAIGYADTKLRKNTYTALGYVFQGWNTESDGTGRAFADGQEIINLTAENQGEVILYAQWCKAESTLRIDPNEGLYDGKAGIILISNDYGKSYFLDSGKIVPPIGQLVTFEPNGGACVENLRTKKRFYEWQVSEDFQGVFQDDIYTYMAEDGYVDTITALYQDEAFLLPEAEREGYIFAGWYEDKACTEFVGRSGDAITTSNDMTLYAKWSQLVLEAYDNYDAYGGSGAVDLSWSQLDEKEAYYKLYQSEELQEWQMIYDADVIMNSTMSIDETIDCFSEFKTYEVPYAGYYTLSAYGGKGGDFQEFQGGLGGYVTATYWLKKGDIISIYSGSSGSEWHGGTNGKSAGGGTAAEISGAGGGAGTEICITRNDKTEHLLIAGGGGGASEKSSGEHGGNMLSVIGNMSGASSDYGGGGGGAVGGEGGIYLAHYHMGSPTEGGGCYTKTTDTVVCGTAESSGGYYECYDCGATWGDGSHSYYDKEHPNNTYNKSYKCTGCGTKLKKGKTHYKTETVIKLTCEYYDKPDGYIMHVNSAEGGSSYINTSYGCKEQAYGFGENNGDGYGVITGQIEPFVEETSLKGVKARDNRSPKEILLRQENVKFLDTGIVKVTWNEPLDEGSVYYHMCESFLLEERLLESNITKNTITSGIKGYYYRLDENRESIVTSTDSYVENIGKKGCVEIPLGEGTRYLHVAAVDVAGNMSDTTHMEMCIDSNLGPQYPADDSYVEKNKLFTEQLTLEDTEYVYQKEEKVWFVKADGTTEHMLRVNASMDKAATSDFQIDILQINACNDMEKEGLEIEIPYGNVSLSAEKIFNDMLSVTMDTEMIPFFSPGISWVERKNHAVKVELSQGFLVDKEVSVFQVYPKAIATFKEKRYTSEEEMDLQNGITIIPDGEAPRVMGVDALQNMDILDITETSAEIVLWAEDDLSGLQEFSVCIHNKDNHMKEEFACDGNGRIKIELDKENPLFTGEIVISAVAIDQVNNAYILGEDGLTFTLETKLYGERYPERNILKNGDGVILDIFTKGYVERVEVVMPEELAGVDGRTYYVFEYDIPALRGKERIKFHIPLNAPWKEYELIVKAYKNGQMLISKPTVVVVKGSVLDELRTRIRNNG